MRAVIQRVKSASVSVDGKELSVIQKGFLVLLGIELNDSTDDADWLAKKIASLRVFSDPEGLMNLALDDVNGSALVVSQFTLHAKTKKGSRPSFIRAARPEQAIPLYEKFIESLDGLIKNEVKSGEFGAAMDVELINWGPVTILIDTKNKE